jgi:excisionase family DNA binding protein
MDIKKLLTTAQAAAVIGITPGRVRQLARSGEIKAVKYLDRHFITPREAKRVAAVEHPLGRPRGAKNLADR